MKPMQFTVFTSASASASNMLPLAISIIAALFPQVYCGDNPEVPGGRAPAPAADAHVGPNLSSAKPKGRQIIAHGVSRVVIANGGRAPISVY